MIYDSWINPMRRYAELGSIVQCRLGSIVEWFSSTMYLRKHWHWQCLLRRIHGCYLHECREVAGVAAGDQTARKRVTGPRIAEMLLITT
jgi:hypothetical protein